ncbi:MAG: flagellar basal body P-ring formation chaperone FlgA [Acidiferrobacterales bacterium]
MIFNDTSKMEPATAIAVGACQHSGSPDPEQGFLDTAVGKPATVKNGGLILGMLLMIVISPHLAAQVFAPSQDLESIRNTARQFLKVELSKRGVTGNIKVGQLDSSLRLVRCSKTLEAFFPSHRRKIGKLSIGVRCKGVATWTIYVPARVGVLDKVVVASRALPQGRLITTGDVQLVTRDLANLTDGYLLRLRDAIGQPLRRPLTIGAVITPASIQPAGMVRRGDKVTILAHRKGVEVRIPGIAMADGAPGDRIKVRNSLNKKINEGVVTRYGEIKVEI